MRPYRSQSGCLGSPQYRRVRSPPNGGAPSAPTGKIRLKGSLNPASRVTLTAGDVRMTKKIIVAPETVLAPRRAVTLTSGGGAQ